MKIHKRIFIITVCGLILWSMGVACNRSGMLEESDPEAASVTAAALEDSVTTGGQASEGEASSRPDPAAIEYAQAVQTIAEEAARKQGALTDEMQKKEQMASDVEAHVEEFVKYAEQKYGREAVIDALVERKDAQEATLTTLEAAKADADTAAAGATAEEKEAIDEEAVAAAAATAEQKEADEKEEATLTDEQLEAAKKEEAKATAAKMERVKQEKDAIASKEVIERNNEIQSAYYMASAINHKVGDEYVKGIPSAALDAAIEPTLTVLRDSNATAADIKLSAADLTAVAIEKEEPPPVFEVVMETNMDDRSKDKEYQDLGVQPDVAPENVTTSHLGFSPPVDGNGDPRDPDFTVELDFSESTVPPGPYEFSLGGIVNSNNKRMTDDFIFEWLRRGDQNNSLPVWFKDPTSINAGDTFKIRANGVINGHLAGVAVKTVTWDPANPVVRIKVKEHSGSDPNPPAWEFDELPPLCPRLQYDVAQKKYYYDAYVHVPSIPNAPYDPMYFPYPRFIEQQPDYSSPGQQAFTNNNIYDGCNMLMIGSVHARFDYEDKYEFNSWLAEMVDEDNANIQPIPQTQPPASERVLDPSTYVDNDIMIQLMGIQSNFYFVTMPCRPAYYMSFGGLNYEGNWLDYTQPPPDPVLWKLQIQPLLHILQGELNGHRGQFEDPEYWIDDQIGFEMMDHPDFAQTFLARYPTGFHFPQPSHRLQGFLPSLFEGQTSNEAMFGGAPYTKCEWLDTFSQAPSQSLEYQNFAIWDWDIPISQDEEPECVMVAFIEGDDMEQHCYPEGFNVCGATAFQHPTDLSEDLIALFKVERNNIQQVYRNNKHSPNLPNLDYDFEVTFYNADLPTCQSSGAGQ